MTDEARGDVAYLASEGETKMAVDARRKLVLAIARAAQAIEAHPWVGEPLRDDGEIAGIGGFRKLALDPEGKMHCS